MTCYVLSKTLNPTYSLTLILLTEKCNILALTSRFGKFNRDNMYQTLSASAVSSPSGYEERRPTAKRHLVRFLYENALSGKALNAARGSGGSGVANSDTSCFRCVRTPCVSKIHNIFGM